jgi:hypothetical protein
MHLGRCCAAHAAAADRAQGGSLRASRIDALLWRQMAKKTQTPRPPRPVQAPRRRDAPPRPRRAATGMPRWPWLAGAAVLAGIVAAVIVLSGGSSPSTAAVGKAMVAAGCTYQDVKPLPPKNKVNYHSDVPKLTTPMNGLWNTFPPAAGAHYGLWAVWGFYTDPVNPRQVVHNEEHGAVVIWWGPKVSGSTVDKLQGFYNQQPVGVFGTPLDATIGGKSLGNKVALTAWTGNTADYYRNGYYGVAHVAICPGFNQKAFATFRNAFRGHGPEGIPLSLDKPGMGPG